MLVPGCVTGGGWSVTAGCSRCRTVVFCYYPLSMLSVLLCIDSLFFIFIYVLLHVLIVVFMFSF